MTLARAAPAIFVLLWSTGWIAPVYAMGHASAQLFLSVRFGFALVAFILFSLLSGARWPRTGAAMLHGIVSGMLLHGVYLGGVWWAIFNGVPAAMSGVIAALQPLATAALVPWLVNERLSRGQLAGLFLGFLGILLALSPSFQGVSADVLAKTAFPFIVNIVAMSGQVLGAIYQKKYLQTGDLRTNAVFQYVGALLVMVPLAFLVEPPFFDFSLQLWLVVAWSVLGLSMGGVGLYLYLIRRGQVSGAASLMYLIPPTVAVESLIFLGEPLSWTMMAGTLIVVIGVWLANRRPSV